jgi:Holliday junction DNA helicase RuvA
MLQIQDDFLYPCHMIREKTMIHYCKGTVTSLEADRGQLVLEVGESLGFRFFCTKAVFDMAILEEPLFLFVHLQPQEDAGFLLFGFADENERTLFSMLTSVRGVGSRMAMLIMSSLQIQDILEAIVDSKASLFAALPGIGKKISERLCFELSEKVVKALGEGILRSPSTGAGATSSAEGTAVRHTVLEALLSLGFGRREAQVAMEEALSGKENSLPDESTLLHETLRRLQR